MRHPILLVLVLWPIGFHTHASEPTQPVAAAVESTLKTDADQVRQLAFDGDEATFYAAHGDAGDDARFTLRLDRPVSLASVTVLTGRPGGGDRLEEGVLEISADGTTFTELARFQDGQARATPERKEARAIRIRPSGERKQPLVVREVVLDSTPKVATFAYPVEFSLDVTDAPDMKEWVERAARECERAYPMINEELRSDGFTAPRRIALTLKSQYRGVAATSGDRIVGSVRFFKQHPDDVGAMIHETVHVVQHYRHGNNPGWLVEGVADYVRFFKYEPGKLGPINPKRAHYDQSYRVSAAFLAYLVETYDGQIVRKLNALMREGRYTDDTFKELTGKTPQQLDEEWRKTLR